MLLLSRGQRSGVQEMTYFPCLKVYCEDLLRMLLEWYHLMVAYQLQYWAMRLTGECLSLLQDARSSYRRILTDSARKLNAQGSQLGTCIEKARPYYEARRLTKEVGVFLGGCLSDWILILSLVWQNIHLVNQLLSTYIYKSFSTCINV